MAESTTIDFTIGAGDQGLSVADNIVRYEKYIDTATVNLAATTSYALLDVPEGHMHLSTMVEIITAEGGTATADLGITGGDVDGLLDGVDLNAAAGTIYYSGEGATAEAMSVAGANAGYTTPDGGVTFSLLANNALDAAQFRITSVWLNMKSGLTQMGEYAV